MNTFTTKIKHFLHPELTPDQRKQRERWAIQREWDHQRAKAMSERDRAEIDAIFSRAFN